MCKSTKLFGTFNYNLYLCIRKAALGNLNASIHCARLHFLCIRIHIERYENKRRLYDYTS